MNALGIRILKILQGSPLGDMSEYLLVKQATDCGLDLKKLKDDDIPILCERFEKILPFFIGNKTTYVIEKIKNIKVKTI